MDFSLLIFFIPVFAAISITPGLCMTLALTMGMRIGVRQTMKMMVGELAGVLLIVTVVVVGGGGFIASHPLLLTVFKYVGGLYLVFVGAQMMRSLGKLGNFRKTVEWDMLGTARNFVFRLSMSDPVQFTLISACVNPEN